MEATKNSVVTTTQEKNITDEVLSRINVLKDKGELQIPQNYSAANALKSAWLILQETVDKDKKPALQVCSKNSICNALLDMVIQGLSPAKKQCYFVAFGGKLQLMRSYMGTIAATKRLKGVKNVYANCIYEGDEFEYKINLETGLKEIIKHEQKFENIDISKIKGAYAVIVRENEPPYIEIMNINQIKKAWNQGAAKGQSGAHQNFTDEMVKKTVINRACKLFVNTTDDSDILIGSINNTSEYSDDDIVNNIDYEVKEEIKENANSKLIDIQPELEKQDSQHGQVSMEGPGF